MVEILGLIGMSITLYGFTRKERELRLYNLVGALIVTVYGILIGSLTTSLLNGALVGINMYMIAKDNI